MTYKGIGEYLAITLTTGADSITPTNAVLNNGLTTLTYKPGNGDDLFRGTNDTLTALDNIDGGNGKDVLEASVATAGNNTVALSGASVANVEVFKVRNIDAVANNKNVLFNADLTVGATEIYSNNSTGSVTVSNVATGAAVGMIGNGVAANGGFQFNYKTTAADVTLNFQDGVKMDGADYLAFNNGVAAAGGVGTATGTATKATINSTGATNTVAQIALSSGTVTNLTINAATNLKVVPGTAVAGITGFAANSTITVAGAATSVDVNLLDANVKTVDAAGLTTGGLTATLNAGVASLTGGKGNDVITTHSTTKAGATINAGDGARDVLVLAATNDVSTSAKAGQYTNFEVLRVAKAAQGDLSIFGSGIVALELNAMTSASLSGISATQAADITVRGDQATALTLGLANTSGTSDVVSLTFKNPSETANTKADVDLENLKIDGVETLKVKLASGDTTFGGSAENTLSFAAASTGQDKLTTIALSGDRGLSIDLSDLTQAISLTTTDMTGTAGLKVTAGAVGKGSVINGTANADDFTAVAAVGTSGDYVTYSLGAGNDTFNTTAAIINNSSAANASLKISGGDGSDTLALSDNGLTLADAKYQWVSGFEKITHSAASAVSISGGGHFNTAFANGVEMTLSAIKIVGHPSASKMAHCWRTGRLLKKVASRTASIRCVRCRDVARRYAFGGEGEFQPAAGIREWGAPLL